MKNFQAVLLLCCLSGCKSADVDKPGPNPRPLMGLEKTLAGTYFGLSGDRKFKLALREDGNCELLQDDKLLDDLPMRWGIHKSEVIIQIQWVPHWRNFMHLKVENSGKLIYVAESMNSGKRKELPKSDQTIFNRIDD